MAILTDRQIEVLKLIANGSTRDQAAEELEVKRVTINKHMKRVFVRLRVGNKKEAIQAAVREGLIHPKPLATPDQPLFCYD